MGAFDWVSYREWSQLDSVESCETVGEEEKASCNITGRNQQVARCFHQNILGDVVWIEYSVETISISYIQVGPRHPNPNTNHHADD